MPRLRPNAPRAARGRTVDILVSFKEDGAPLLPSPKGASCRQWKPWSTVNQAPVGVNANTRGPEGSWYDERSSNRFFAQP